MGWSAKKTRRIRDLAGVKIVRRRKARPGYRQETPGNLLLGAARPDGGYEQAALESLGAWGVDYSHFQLGGRTFYLSLVVDLASRMILAWDLGRNQKSELVVSSLGQALENYGPPKVVHSDRGSQYLSADYRRLLAAFDIRQSLSAAGSPWQNGFVERTFRSLKEEFDPPALKGCGWGELLELVAATVYYYNRQRYHTSLKTTPAAYHEGLKKPPAEEKKLCTKVLN